MKRDIGFTKIRRRVIARAINEEAGVGLRGKAGMQEAEKAIGCQGKERFESHTQASAVINRKKGKRHDRRQVYACKACRGFHVGGVNS